MTRVTGSDCAVMCNLINIHSITYMHTYIHSGALFDNHSRLKISFRTRHHLCRQGVALASTRQPHSQGPASVQAHRTGGVTETEGQEGANGAGGGERGRGWGTGSGVGLESGAGTETATGT